MKGEILEDIRDKFRKEECEWICGDVYEVWFLEGVEYLLENIYFWRVIKKLRI